MAASKTAKTLLASQSLAAAGSVSATEWNMSTAYGGLAAVKLSLPGSAPTTAPTVTFYVGESTGTKRKFYTASASTTSGDYPMDFVCELPPSAMFANITITNGATNGITVEAYGQELTGI
jgi:hypothetical protein